MLAINVNANGYKWIQKRVHRDTYIVRILSMITCLILPEVEVR